MYFFAKAKEPNLVKLFTRFYYFWVRFVAAKISIFIICFSGTESGDILGWRLEKFFTKSDMKPHDPKKKIFAIPLRENAYTGISYE